MSNPTQVVESAAAGAGPEFSAVSSSSQTAAEQFLSPDAAERERGFEALMADRVARGSRLAAFLLAARVDEPDLPLRARIVAALAGYLDASAEASAEPGRQRGYVDALLRRFGREQVERLLETAAGGSQTEGEALLTVLDRVPDISAHLTRLAAARLAEPALRHAALWAARELGLLDALPPLEGLEARLVGRQAGQLPMAFAPPADPADEALLADLRETIRALKADD